MSETSLKLTPARRKAKETLSSQALVVTAESELEQLKTAAVHLLSTVAQFESKTAWGAILSGLHLHRVKASLKHGEFEAWQKQIRTSGSFLPSVRMCQFYMRLATVFVEKTKVGLPHLLACPGDQMAIETADTGDARALGDKLKTFVGDQSLNDLFDRYKIKERQEPQGSAANGGNLGKGAPVVTLSPAEALELARIDARKWFQEQTVWWQRHFVEERSFQHLATEATTDGELTLGQFKQLLGDTLKAVEAEEKSRRKAK